MRQSLGILKRDIFALVRNPIALLVVVALLVLPGLYAWYCILANWNPYSNTGSMPIAVVNKDRGVNSDIAGNVNVGGSVTEKLKDNNSIDWQIYQSEEEALHDTRLGIVYATIVIPEDLSKNLVGIFSGSSEKPTIYYYPNEKYNAVATKVTDSASQTLIEQINQNFSSTVNQKVLQKVQGLSQAVEQRADETNRSALAEIREIQADLDKIIASLDDASASIDGWRNAADGARLALGTVNEKLPTIAEALERGSGKIDSLRTQTSSFTSRLSSSILSSASTIARLSAQSSSTLAQTEQDLAGILARLKAIEDEASSTSSLELQLAALSLDITTTLIQNIVAPVEADIAEMDSRVQKVSQDISNATNQISNEVMPQLDSGTYGLATAFSRLSGAIDQFEPQIKSLQDVLEQTDRALDEAKVAIADAQTLLTSVSSHLKGTITDIGAIGNALQIDQLAKLLDTDPENVGTFISSPVKMETEKVYPVSNYGTGVAPFYTNLALWVGCFILVSLMKVEVNVAGLGTTTARQRYYGRWLLFIILSLLQSQAICGVDILLGIDCAHPGLFMLAGAVCSFAYMNVIYALVKTFRNIGRTLCILLLIMQVPGSSGMYPIQMMPDLFQVVHPMLPFTYGIDAMREALCGVYGMRYPCDLAVLLLIVPVSLAFGLLLRPLMANLLVMIDDEMRKVGFFASEEHSIGLEKKRLSSVMYALAMHDDYADDIEERAWRFSRAYKRLIKAGKTATFVIPFAFLVLIFPFNLALDISINTKLFILMIMIILLLIVLFMMIVVEYMHHAITEEAKMLGASIIDDMNLAELAQDVSPDEGSNGNGAERGGPIWDIFSTDMRLGFQSSVGVVVIMLLAITPAMYAWFNIAGSWNPYASTGNLKVAVANEDAGYKGELMPITINVGDTIVSQLRGNTNFEWVFVGKDEAISGVEGSTYYAAIVIPSDFSANMMTYLVDDTDYPNVQYYTNEKENPIAPIITQKGANAIQENIRVSFTESVDAIVLSVAYDVLSYVKNPRLSDYVVKMSRHLDDATGDGKSAARELRELAALAKTVSSIVNAAGTTADGLLAAGNSAKTALGDAKSGLSDATSALDRAMSIAKGMIEDRSIDISRLKEIVDSALAIVEAGAEAVPTGIDSSIDRFNGISDLTEQEAALRDALVEALREAKQHAEAVPGQIQEADASLDALIDDADAELAQTRKYFNEDVLVSVSELSSIIEEITTTTSSVVNGLEGTIGGIGESTDGLSKQLSSLSSGLGKTSDKLEAFVMNIEYEKTRISNALSSGDIKQVEGVVLGNDPELLARTLSAPVVRQREAIYPVENFGSAMASFYSVLSLWVGALVMISTMRVHVVEERLEELRRRYGKIRPRHEFFGRYAIFGFIGLVQSAIVLLGDLLFLHIQCVNPIMFLVLGVLVGQAFCLIVYTLTELFGSVGKAICVILLIMQVAASGGTFPIEMLDPILMNISVFLPFFHAMSLLQECVCGIEWISIVLHLSALVIMVGLMLVMGLPLRRPFRKLNDFFETQLEKTGYM